MTPDDFNELALKVVFDEADEAEREQLRAECAANSQRAGQVESWRRELGESREAFAVWQVIEGSASQSELSIDQIQALCAGVGGHERIIHRSARVWWRTQRAWMGLGAVAACLALVVTMQRISPRQPDIPSGAHNDRIFSNSNGTNELSQSGKPTSPVKSGPGPSVNRAEEKSKVEAMLAQLTPEQRDQLDLLPAKKAWELMMGWAEDVPPSANARKRTEAAMRFRAGAEALASSKITADFRVDLTRAILVEASGRVSALLHERSSRKTPTGPRYAIAVGEVAFVPLADVPAGTEQAALLLNRIDPLSANDALREQFALVPYALHDEAAIIRCIGGGTTDWLKSPATALPDEPVVLYHPDDIFVLTGNITERMPAVDRLDVEFATLVRHPRTDWSRGLKITATRLYHPTRGWLTVEQNQSIQGSGRKI